MPFKKLTFSLILFVIFSVSLAFSDNIPGTYFDLQKLEKNHAGYIVAILEGNIFRVFSKDLGSYDTDLKKKLFLNSEAANPYVEKINELKNIIRTQGVITYFDQRNNKFSDYDIKDGGFWVILGDTENDGDFMSLNNFIYDKIKITVERRQFAGVQLASLYKIFIPVKEDIAVEMEGNKNLRLKAAMKVSGTKTVKTTAGGFVFTEVLPVASSLTLTVFDGNKEYVTVSY